MTRSVPFALVLTLLCGSLSAAPSGLDAHGHLLAAVAAGDNQAFSYVKLEHGVQFRVGGVTKNVIFYGPQTVRVNANAGQNFWTQPSIVVDTKPADVAFEVSDEAGELAITSAKLRIVVDKKTGALALHDRERDQLYVQEKTDAPQKLTPRTISGQPTYEAENTFTLKPEESIYGFGFVDQDKVNRRGRDLLLVQTNIGIIIPMMISSERYGIMWDTYSKMTFKDDANGAKLWAESAPGGVDYYFFGGDTLDDVIANYRTLTGVAPMYPKQAFGLFMSKERYPTRQRLVEVAQTFRKEAFPLDYIVQDWQYWGSDKDGSWSGMTFNKERYPDPVGMTQAIHDLHMKLMISIWPSVGNDTALAKELDEHGLRFEPLHWISRKARIYDAYSPLGRQIYFKYVKSGLLDKGIDALWMDGTEVEVGGACHNAGEVERDIKSLGNNAMGDFTRYLNPYTLMTTKGTYEGQRATSDRRVLTLTRSAWTGAQRYAAASWSGDTTASWQTLQEQIAGGVNVCMAGNPYFTQDTGGFFVNYGGGEHNPEYRELFARWFQYAVFNPLMRIHGTSVEREPYIFKTIDPPMYDSLVKAVDLRYRLLPYIYGLGWKVTNDGYTMMRGLVMDFPTDKHVADVNDEFMFGPSLLAHPVTRTMYHAEAPLPPLVPAEVLNTPDGRAGIAVQYFDGMNFEKPAGTSVDAKVDYTWPGPPLAGPPPGLNGFDYFSARFEGTITAPESGEYEIGVEGDDGYRLFLNGNKVVEDWAARDKTFKSTRITLEKGQKLPIKIEYFNHTAARVLRLLWRTPTELKSYQPRNGPDTSMQTYLPEAPAGWYDFWTNDRLDGGKTVTTDAPLDRFPVFVRAGSILPLGPTQQYATEKPDAPYEIRVYPGANATFTIYEDDNETYAYEKGQRATYELTWDDASKTLSVGARQGAFPGMVAKRQLNVVLASPGKNAGHTGEPVDVKTITYDGTAASVKF